MHGRYSLHRFSDALGLVILCIFTTSVTFSGVSHSTLSTASSRMDIQSSDLDVRTSRHCFSIREDF